MQRPDPGGSDRRDFLKTAATLSVAAAAGGSATGAPGQETAEQETDASKMPQIRLGPHSVSRLICGNNPFGGGSHLSGFVNRQMKEYYTKEQIFKTLRRCQEVGINCWQAGGGTINMYREFTDAGLKMHYLAIEADRPQSSPLEKLVDGGCIGVAHHGEVTDQLFKSGKIDEVNEYLKKVRDSGLLVGVSTHMPDVVDTIESKGWDLDYYMTCVYERHRSAEELEKLLGQAPIPVGEVYLPNDPPRMFKVVRATKRPCLAFKILAAGRLSDRRQWVEKAFRDTYESIKPTDAAILGIYDRYTDQPADGAALVRRFGSNGRAT